MRCTRAVVWLVSAVVLVVGPATSALAQPFDYPIGFRPDCIVVRHADGSTGGFFRPNESIIVESVDQEFAHCFDPNTIVDIFFVQSEVQIASVRADADGDYTTRGQVVRIPEDARRGSAIIRSRGVLGDEPISYSERIRIAVTAARGKLPFTGGDILGLILWAAVLLAIGTTLVLAARRRRGSRRGVDPASDEPAPNVYAEPGAR